jgi:hypothetical protein
MPCEEKTRLVEEYKTATKKFADAVTELQRKVGTSPNPTISGLPAPRTMHGLSLNRHASRWNSTLWRTAAKIVLVPEWPRGSQPVS